jgi:YVTN family beta-propeller protein
MFRIACCSLAAMAALLWGASSAAEPRRESLPALRRPVAIVPSADGQRLYVANRVGTVSVVDPRAAAVRSESPVGKRLSSLAPLAGGERLLATDEEAGRLLLLLPREDGVERAAALPVAATPVNVRASRDGSLAAVASLWARRVSLVEIAREPTPAFGQVRTVDVPFAPREQLFLPDGSLLVADSHGGQLAVIDVATAKIKVLRKLPGNNIRGLALSPDGKKLLVSHQILTNLAETTHNDIHWGILMTNLLRWIELARLFGPEEELLKGSHVHLLGDPGNAASDPAGVAVNANSEVAVALSGVGQVAIGSEVEYGLRRTKVARRPTQVAFSPDGRHVYVANTFADSISVVEAKREPQVREISLGPQADLGLADKGEMLFYDGKMSLEGWMSCHSCHTDGHTNGLMNDNLSDGSFGAPKRVLSLLGTANTSPWAWKGDVHDLEGQILQSIRTTMLGPEPGPGQVEALAQFIRTLTPPPARAELLGLVDKAAVARGAKVFRAQSCDGCHAGPNFTTGDAFDVGLKDKVGNQAFNPPSLVGVSQAGPYFHDSRAATLEEVFTKHKHQLPRELPKQDLTDLLEFLRSL